MHYHIILTELCDSRCKYCYEKSLQEFSNGLEEKFEFDFSAPTKSNIKTEDLKKFLKNDPSPTLIFYGGEPLLEIEKIKEIIDAFPKLPFRMQTNAKLLDKLPIDYLNKIGKLLISIDGDKSRTDLNRGEGTYKKVLENIKKAKDQGYAGEIVARMTISFPDIYPQVQHLIQLQKVFDSVHWQLDVAFYKFDFNEEKFQEFSKKYNKEISKLIDFWIENLEKGKVIKIYPFLGIINRLLGFDSETRLMCGAGHSGYAITTGGKIQACPIMNNIKNFECGNLESEQLKKIDLIEPCTSCEESSICGGRCLYSNHAKLWGEKGEKMICDNTKHLILKLRKNLPKIKELLDKKIISQENLEYEKYFGPEIIP